MASSPASGGLMLHQKDEHDIWICKACGWKYPNAKPSAKIRKHHKRQCPGAGGPDSPHHEEMSGNEASDDEHFHEPRHGPQDGPPHESHHEPHQGPSQGHHEATLFTNGGDQQIAVSAKKDWINDDKSVQNNGAGYGNRSVSSPSSKEQEEKGPKTDDGGHDVPTPPMEHQKDEHDIWICKECGWKYPNARPSPKVKRHHRKQCPGRKGSAVSAAGGSSDEREHSGDEGLHEHSGDEGLHEHSPRAEEEDLPAENLTQPRKAKRSVRFADDVAPGESDAADSASNDPAKDSNQNLAASDRLEIPSGADSGGQEISEIEGGETQDSREVFTSGEDIPKPATSSNFGATENQEGAGEVSTEDTREISTSSGEDPPKPATESDFGTTEDKRAAGEVSTENSRDFSIPNGEDLPQPAATSDFGATENQEVAEKDSKEDSREFSTSSGKDPPKSTAASDFAATEIQEKAADVSTENSRETSKTSGDDPPKPATTPNFGVIENREEAGQVVMENDEAHDGKQAMLPVESRKTAAVRGWGCGRKGTFGSKFIQGGTTNRWKSGGRWNLSRIV